MSDIIRRFQNNAGLNLRATEITKDPNHATETRNVRYSKSGDIEKRPGQQVRISSVGGFGIHQYNKINQTTGAITKELINIGQWPWRRSTTTFAITYSGSGVAKITIRAKSDATEREMYIEEDGSEVVTVSLGDGYDESSPVTLAALKTAIDAETGFAATITGTTTIPAALLKTTKEYTLSPSNTTLSLDAYEWELVNTTVSTPPFAGSESNKNTSDFENASFVELNNILYISNGYDPIHKYDGQGCYLAGLPIPLRPTLSNTASGGGISEVTDITTRAEAAVAHVRDVTCVADSSDANEFDITITNAAAPSNLKGNYIFIYGWNNTSGVVEKIALWFSREGQPTSAPSTDADRSIEVPLLNSDSSPTLIGDKVATAINADASFSASNSSGTVSVVDAFNGERPVPSLGTVSPNFITLTVTTSGAWGLHQSYFLLDTPTETVAVWYDLNTFGVEPDHGADRALEVTAVTFGDSANTVATETSSIINADSAFSSSPSSDVIAVTNATSGAVLGTAGAGTSGFSLSTTTLGLDSLIGKYIILYEGPDEDDDSVAVWFSDGSVAEPAHGADRSISSSITAADSANTVASNLQSAINGDSAFGATVLTNVVTVTNASTGAVPDFTTGNASITLSTTTQGSEGGVGTGTFKYLLTFTQKDAAGNIITGEPSAIPNKSIVISTGTDNVSMNIQGIQAGSGYNTGCAIINGNQTGVTTITVNSGHTLVAGDTAYFLDETSGVNAYTERIITSVTSTTIVISGNAVDVSDDGVISNNLRINIYRTTAGGAQYYLVESIPNDSINGSFTYIDGEQDDNLTVEYIEQIKPHTLPPKGRYLASFRGQLVIAGDPENVNTVYYSHIGADGNTSEYFPAANSVLVQSEHGDKITGLGANNEFLAVFKERSIFTWTGDLQSGVFQVDNLTSGEIGCASHHSIQEVMGSLFWLDVDGVYAMTAGSLPTEVSRNIRPIFTDVQTFTDGEYSFKRSVAYNDRRGNEEYLLFLPVEATSPGGNKYFTDESKLLVFNYFRGAWSVWDSINMGGGVDKVDDDIFFAERRYSSTLGSVTKNVRTFNRTGADIDYSDHRSAIIWQYRGIWENDGKPESFKRSIRWKPHLTRVSQSPNFSLRVTAEHDLTPGSFVTDFTRTIRTDPLKAADGSILSIPADPTFKQKMKGRRWKTQRLGMFNGSIHENPIISGYTIEISNEYEEGISE